MAKNEELYFKTADALDYALRQGYPFGKSKFYADMKYIPRVDKKFAKSEIDKYIKDKIIGSSGLTASDDAAEKIRQDARASKGRADKYEFENEVARGLYIPISDLEKELAHRGALLKIGIESFFTTSVRDMIEICNGDSDKEGPFINYCLDAMEDHFDQYSKDVDFDVPVVNLESEGIED